MTRPEGPPEDHGQPQPGPPVPAGDFPQSPVRPVEEGSAEGVFRRLRDAILSGALPPGEPLPGERVLAQRLQVGRSAVREAMARLRQLGLTAIRQGDDTRVQDWRRHAGLDLLPALLMDATASASLMTLRSCMEMRAAIGPDACRLCALRSAHTGQDLLRLCRDMEKERDLGVLRTLNIRFWELLVQGSHNLAYQLAYNSLRAAFDRFGAQALPAMAAELTAVEGFRAMAEAVAAADPERAWTAARDHLQHGLGPTLAALGGLG